MAKITIAIEDHPETGGSVVKVEPSIESIMAKGPDRWTQAEAVAAAMIMGLLEESEEGWGVMKA